MDASVTRIHSARERKAELLTDEQLVKLDEARAVLRKIEGACFRERMNRETGHDQGDLGRLEEVVENADNAVFRIFNVLDAYFSDPRAEKLWRTHHKRQSATTPDQDPPTVGNEVH